MRSNRWLGAIAALLWAIGAAQVEAQQIQSSGATTFAATMPGAKRAGRFYGPPETAVPANAAIPFINRLWMQPMFFGAASTVKTMAFDIGTGNAAAWNARICMYADNGAGIPGSLAIDSGTVAIGAGSVVGVQTAAINGANGTLVPAGWYWVGMMADSVVPSLFSANNSNGYYITSLLTGWGSALNSFTNVAAAGYYMTQTFGACPGAFTVTGDNSNNAVPYIVLGF